MVGIVKCWIARSTEWPAKYSCPPLLCKTHWFSNFSLLQKERERERERERSFFECEACKTKNWHKSPKKLFASDVEALLASFNTVTHDGERQRSKMDCTTTCTCIFNHLFNCTIFNNSPYSSLPPWKFQLLHTHYNSTLQLSIQDTFNSLKIHERNTSAYTKRHE